MRPRKAVKRSRRGPLDIEQCVAANMTFASTLKSKYIKLFVSIIKSLNFVNCADIELTENGLKYIVEESKSFQVKAFIMESFFHKFLFKPTGGLEVINFGVNLTSVTELLTAFIDNDLGNMIITYFHKENRIVFTCTQVDSGQVSKRPRLQSIDEEDSNIEEPPEIRTEYFIRTMHSNEPISFDASGQVASDLILDAAFLLTMLNDFDRNIEEIEFKITQRKFQLKTHGVHQSGAIAKLSSSNDTFDKFLCKTPTRFNYKFAYFRVLMKALGLASKVSIRTFDDGSIRIQLKIRTDEESSAFVEYSLMPMVEDDWIEEN